MQEKGEKKYSSSYCEARNRSYHQIKLNGASPISSQGAVAFPSFSTPGFLICPKPYMNPRLWRRSRDYSKGAAQIRHEIETQVTFHKRWLLRKTKSASHSSRVLQSPFSLPMFHRKHPLSIYSLNREFRFSSIWNCFIDSTCSNSLRWVSPADPIQQSTGFHYHQVNNLPPTQTPSPVKSLCHWTLL